MRPPHLVFHRVSHWEGTAQGPAPGSAGRAQAWGRHGGTTPLILSLVLTLTAGSLAACTQEPLPGETTPEPVQTETAEEIGALLVASYSLSDLEPYVPASTWTPDTVPADTLGEVLEETELMDGQQVLCYREPGSGTRERFETLLDQAGISVRQKWVCHSSDSILAAVAQGQGLSVVSRQLAEQSAKELHTLPVEDVKLHRTFNLIYHKNKFLSEPLRAFLGELLPADQLGS